MKVSTISESREQLGLLGLLHEIEPFATYHSHFRSVRILHKGGFLFGRRESRRGQGAERSAPLFFILTLLFLEPGLHRLLEVGLAR